MVSFNSLSLATAFAFLIPSAIAAPAPQTPATNCRFQTQTVSGTGTYCHDKSPTCSPGQSLGSIVDTNESIDGRTDKCFKRVKFECCTR
ncbi:hypothetical protein M3J09_005607 [Ascochyta lentis]